jgi:hypothetical protein
MDARSELFVYLGSTLATIAGLFAVQLWYESYLDVSVVHAMDRGAPLERPLQEVRDAEQAKLGSGKLPIEQAIAGLAQRGRAGFPKIAPKPSDDLSAMSGWIHKPGFTPYVPRPAPKPVAEVAPEGAVPAEGAAVPAEGSAAEGATGAAPAGAPAPPVAAGTAPAAGAATAPAPSAPAGTTAEAAKAAAARVRPAGTRAPIVAPPGRTPEANPAR